MQHGKHFRYLLGNVIIGGVIRCESGLHIGGSSDTLEIGGIDSPVIRNPLTNEPYIPGSSLKGKLRSITEKIVSKNGKPLQANRDGGDKDKKVWRHECDDFADAIECPLCRIFGSTGKGEKGDKGDNKNNLPAALLVRDGKLCNPDKLKDQYDIPIFEVKVENSLDRLTSAAHPRRVERVPAGAEFGFELVYRIEAVGEGRNDTDVSTIRDIPAKRLKEDMAHLVAAMEILEYDGIGGHISRGSGKIEFSVTRFEALKNDGSVLASIGKNKIGEVRKELDTFSNQITMQGIPQ